jgi:hypothetical protein
MSDHAIVLELGTCFGGLACHLVSTGTLQAVPVSAEDELMDSSVGLDSP